MSRDSGSKVKKIDKICQYLKFSGMVDLNVNLCLTTFGGGGQQVKGQRSKNKFYQNRSKVFRYRYRLKKFISVDL